MRFIAVALALAALIAQPPRRIDVLRSTGALPAYIAGSFQRPLAYQQSDAGEYFVFDRRAHAVYAVAGDAVRKIVEIGAEPGRVLDPTAFDMNPADGRFVVADAPLRRQRIQAFTTGGARLGGFTLPTREVARITLDTIVLNGVGSIQFTGESVLINQPETGVLVSELSLYGESRRGFGALRPTGHEGDVNLHLALNSGLPLIDPTGGVYFVFVAGVPAFRKYDAGGRLVYERHVEGAELDEYQRSMPTEWPARRSEDGNVLPLVPPAIRAAGVDRQGRLWVTLMQPYTYVYDRSGDKLRTVQFRGADVLSPSSLFFTRDGRVLVTPGCYEFRPGF